MAEKLKIFKKRKDGLDPVSPTNNIIKINDHELGLLVEESQYYQDLDNVISGDLEKLKVVTEKEQVVIKMHSHDLIDQVTQKISTFLVAPDPDLNEEMKKLTDSKYHQVKQEDKLEREI